MKKVKINLLKLTAEKREGLLGSLPADVLDKIYEQREAILKSFIAQMGCKPSEVIQVIRFYPDRVVWGLHRKVLED